MNGQALSGRSLPDMLLNQLEDLSAVLNAGLTLCAKTWKSSISQRQCQVENWPELLILQELKRKSVVIEEVMERVKAADVDFLYYERSTCKQHYQQLLLALLSNIEEISKNNQHQFYSQRRVQVGIIQQIITFVDELERKIIQHLADLRIQYPYEMASYVKDAIRLLQRTKVNNKIKIKNGGYQINFNFPPKNLQTPLRQAEKTQKQNSKSKQKRPQTSKFSYTCTNTTRPSSCAGKSLRDGTMSAKIKSGHNTQPASIHENQIVKQISQQKNKNKNILKLERCQTAKQVRQNSKAIQKTQRHPNQQSHPQNNNTGSQVQQKQSVTLLQSVFKRTTTTSNKNSPADISASNIFNTTPKNRLYEDIWKKKKRPRTGRIESNSIGKELNPHKLSDVGDLAGFYKRSQKMSGIVKVKGSYRTTKRNFQSHQVLSSIQQKKTIKRIKTNSPNKKTHLNRRHKPLKINQNFDIPQQTPYQQQKQLILLIKPPQEALKQSRSYLLHKSPEKALRKQPNRNHLGIATIKDLRKSQAGVQISNSEEITSEIFIKDHKLIIDIGEINEIRGEFVKAIWKNKIIGADDQENSVFFIEQGFLSQRENTRFQAHLKRLKENYGNQFHRDPFNLQNETQQQNNQKLMQLQRLYAFQTEDEWLTQRYHNQEQSFVQVGLQKMREFVL